MLGTIKPNYWIRKLSTKTSYGYRIDARAYVKVVRKTYHFLWKDSEEIVIFNPNADVGGLLYIGG
ncbi:hypothetical protein PFDSM3638_07685 [Pyrococcus furiosus DSM 3638]|uniref:Uncharacterized protein n=3 Tax=Pyrococcus furiosus TaxID=2261 RepID=Q8U0Q8_PYRFU|nr:hypothetical protein PF1526 [Pyrococcus furiosus DSM 3638]AFN04308.1 hypothetical protein PFC_06860 [Pyrococcus furiosus COM1]MDK2869028.1 hypothetical protein [Pyrococcus sp.]QEK79150.1 hypothetical protein PFDSM3638_07685 [Pyrococcus furiosus DSM 3638]